MINLSLTDLNRVQFREKFTGQLAEKKFLFLCC